ALAVQDGGRCGEDRLLLAGVTRRGAGPLAAHVNRSVCHEDPPDPQRTAGLALASNRRKSLSRSPMTTPGLALSFRGRSGLLPTEGSGPCPCLATGCSGSGRAGTPPAGAAPTPALGPQQTTAAISFSRAGGEKGLASPPFMPAAR